jgi:hypothetical protein
LLGFRTADWPSVNFVTLDRTFIIFVIFVIFVIIVIIVKLVFCPLWYM